MKTSNIKVVTLKNVTSYAALAGKNAKTVDQLIEAAIGSLKTMREKVQVAAVAILQHAEQCGDYSKAQILVDGLGNGINKASLQKWFIDFGGLKYDEDTKQFNGWSGKVFIREAFGTAKATAWWELKKAPEYKGYDVVQALQAVIKQGNAAIKKVSDNPEYAPLVAVNDSQLAEVSALIHKMLGAA